MNRINVLLDKLKQYNCDGFFINSEANITYLSGFTGDSSRLMVSPNGVVLITDGRYTEQAEKECHNEISIFKWIDDNRYQHETYKKVSDDLKIKKICFEGSRLSYSEFTQLKKATGNNQIESLDGIVEEIRIIKSDEEIENLKKACEITDKALHDTLNTVRPGRTEAEIVAELEYNMKLNGSEGISFDTMVLSGARTSLLHGKPGNNKIKEGDFLLFDFGALYKGYHADMSRTFIIGKFNKKQKQMYDIVHDAQINSLQAIKNGVPGKKADDAVREIIPDEYIEFYYPGLGHGVGLEIHEQPFLKNTAEFNFKENMTITVEPGIYIPDLGGLRIEDTVVVKKDGVEILTKFPKDLMIL